MEKQRKKEIDEQKAEWKTLKHKKTGPRRIGRRRKEQNRQRRERSNCLQTNKWT